MARPLFVTGTDTGVGKTVLTAALTTWLRDTGRSVRAVKPLCSGGRQDAVVLHRAQGGGVPLDAVNPWFFRAALTPRLAARREGRPLRRREILEFLREAGRSADRLLVEAAGGLLSPLGEDFDARDLIRELGAWALVVAPNRLGAINQVLLVTEALGRRTGGLRVALMAPTRRSLVSRTNLEVLRERLGEGVLLEIPRFTQPAAPVVGPSLARAFEDWLADWLER